MMGHLLNTMPNTITKLAVIPPPTSLVNFHHRIQNIRQPRQIRLLFLPGFKV
jgi:hypothetical protein